MEGTGDTVLLHLARSEILADRFSGRQTHRTPDRKPTTSQRSLASPSFSTTLESKRLERAT